MMAVTEILRFLAELKDNNDYAWMAAHKDWQKETQAQFAALLQEIIAQLAENDPAVGELKAGELIFRLNRDTRFSHDKSPYNPAYRAHIGPQGRAPIPVGYYLVLSPGRSIIGGGLYAAMFNDATAQIRQYIAGHLNELEAVLQEELLLPALPCKAKSSSVSLTALTLTIRQANTSSTKAGISNVHCPQKCWPMIRFFVSRCWRNAA